MIYQTLNYRVDKVALTLSNSDNKPVNIRPKTCKLLIFLLENAGKPVSKEVLLETVWAGSIVSEQVVFQSINEIRQLFKGVDVIKTIPQQGYLWLPSVTEKTPQPIEVGFKKNYLVAGIILFLSCFIAFWLMTKAPENDPVKGSVVILPTINQVQGNDHNWVRLGVMDQVIQRLPHSEKYGVLQTDYVLEVVKRAKAKFETVDENEIKQMFVVSGAELIVTSSLSGSPFEYKLNYRLYSRTSVVQGVLFDPNIQTLIDQLSQVIAERLGDKPRTTNDDFHADFNNELLGRAIEFRLERKFEAAQSLLQSLVLNEPENITARRILANNLLILGQSEDAEQQLNLAIPIAKQKKDHHELARLLFDKAYYYKRKGELKQANAIANEVLEVSKQNRDWLYMAYSKTLLAQLAMQENNFAVAEALFVEAKEHHQVLRCPVGESISWINLALLAKTQNQSVKFDQAISQAKTIAQNRELSRQLKRIKSIE